MEINENFNVCQNLQVEFYQGILLVYLGRVSKFDYIKEKTR